MNKLTRNLALALTVSAFLSGCAGKRETWRPSAADIETADYGAYPYDYERIVKTWYLRNLKDPDSARFGRITRPLKGNRSKTPGDHAIAVWRSRTISARGWTGMASGTPRRWPR